MARPVDDLVDEYLRLVHSGRELPWHRTGDHEGRVEFCGDEEHGTLTFVRGEKITLLGVGSREETVEQFEALQAEGLQYASVPPASVLWGGEARGFRPLGSGVVLGVAEHGRAALVLGLLKRTCVAVLLDGRRRVVCATPWDQLGVIDLDAFLQLDPPTRRVELCDQEVSDRICGGLRNLVARATAPDARDGRHRGKMAVRVFIDILIALSQVGCGDLSGRAGEIVTQIQVYLPKVTIDVKRLGEVLGLIERTGTVLVERPTERTWLVRLAALRDVTSGIHKSVCAEVPRRRLAPTGMTAGRMLRDLEAAQPELAAREPVVPELAAVASREPAAPDLAAVASREPAVPELAAVASQPAVPELAAVASREPAVPELAVAPREPPTPKNWTTDLKTLVAKVLPAT